MFNSLILEYLCEILGCEQNRNADICQRFLMLDDLFS